MIKRVRSFNTQFNKPQQFLPKPTRILSTPTETISKSPSCSKDLSIHSILLWLLLTKLSSNDGTYDDSQRQYQPPTSLETYVEGEQRLVWYIMFVCVWVGVRINQARLNTTKQSRVLYHKSSSPPLQGIENRWIECADLELNFDWDDMQEKSTRLTLEQIHPYIGEWHERVSH